MKNAQLVGLLLSADIKGFELRLNIDVSDDFDRHLVGDFSIKAMSFASDAALINTTHDILCLHALGSSEAKDSTAFLLSS